MPYIETFGDFLVLNIVFGFVMYLHPEVCAMSSLRLVWLLCNVAFVPVPLWQYRTGKNHRAVTIDKVLAAAFKSVFIQAAVFLSTMAFLHISLPAKVYIDFYVAFAVAFPLWRVIDRWVIKRYRSRGRNYVRVVIVGTSKTGQALAEQMRSDPGYGFKMLGFFDTVRPDNFGDKYAGNIDELADFVVANNVDEIYFALPGEQHEILGKVVKIADDNVIPFYYVPQISRYVRRGFSIQNIGALPVLSTLRNPLNNPVNSVLKRGFDILFSSAFLVVSPVIFIPVAVGIKLSSPGPVFFVQKRTGYKGRTFNCYKFRTMRVNANADKVQATDNDPRKTRFGNFLRHSSIDELPQFINVWLGDMSVVGPRPHMLKHTELYTTLIDKYMVRHVVKPGVTGWAQVNGYRGITDELWKMEKRVECDVWYIEHWTFGLDLKIIARTIINAVSGEKNAF